MVERVVRVGDDVRTIIIITHFVISKNKASFISENRTSAIHTVDSSSSNSW